MSIKKIKEAYVECMAELYANSTPSADFNSLMSEAISKNEIDEFGRPVIPFDDYEIDADKFDEIFKSVAKKYKLRGVSLDSLMFEVYLGASPRSKYNE